MVAVMCIKTQTDKIKLNWTSYLIQRIIILLVVPIQNSVISLEKQIEREIMA